MPLFLKYIAEEISKEYGNDLSNICIIFPNRRSGVFFSHYLSQIIEIPVWPPEITTISNFVEDLSKLNNADRLSLIFKLYEEFRKVIKTSGNFDEFYYWGGMLLNDFDNIDKYLIPADSLFYNLKSLKDIESQFSFLDSEQIKIIKSFWENFNPEKPTVHKMSFRDIWSGLAEIYKLFNERILKEDNAYEGLIFKELVNILKADNNYPLKFDHYLFIGFNALNKCEEFIFDYFRKRNVASFIWDYDELYLKDNIHEAGHFLRNNIRKFPPPKIANEKKLFNNLSIPNRKINVLAVPSDISQAKIINRLLKNIPSAIAESHDQTALVLPEESLLMPVLSSIPEEISDINITMGYPIKNTSVYSFIEFLINLNKYVKEKEEGKCFYYYREVLSILNHQYIVSLKTEESRVIESSIKITNHIYISETDLQLNLLFKQIFNRQSAKNNFPEYLMAILFNILENNSENEGPKERSVSFIEKEFIYKVYLTIKRLSGILDEQNINIGFNVLMKVLLQTISSLRIPFEGEPLKGLQIMGLLETRLLDFENIILLSANEGVLPRRTVDSSYIPYNIRRAFGLPVNEHNDAIYAYYFYRLIQRAKNIYLVYNSSVSDKGISSGEQSRFISQLEKDTDFIIHKMNIGFDLSMTLPEKIRIKKTKIIFERLNRYLSDSGNNDYLSPSALNTYIDCSLRFYFRYIAGLKEAEEIIEDVDSMLFGSIIHKTMEELYKKHLNQTITTEIVDSILKNDDIIRDVIKNSFVSIYNKEDKNIDHELSGKNSLIFEIIRDYVEIVLKFDKKTAPFKIIALEENLYTQIHYTINGVSKKVDIGGTIDRIDSFRDIIRIIDYKTGKPGYSTKDLNTLFEKDNNTRNNSIFQTLVYSKIFYDFYPEKQNICPSIYFIKDLNKPDYNWQIKNEGKLIDNYFSLNEEFSNNLNNLISELFNPEIPFIQTTEEKLCSHCPYTDICGRKKKDDY